MMGFPSRSCNTLREEHFDLGGNHSDTSDDMDVRSVISDDSETSLDTSLEDNQGTNNCCSDDFPSADPQETEQVNPSNLADNPGGEDIDSTQSDNVAVEDTLDNVDIDEAYKCVQVRAGNPADKEAMALVNMNRYIALILLYFVFLNALYMQGSKVVQDEITKLVKDLLARYPILFGAVVCSMKKDNFQLGKMVKDRDAQLWDKDRNIISLESMLQTALANKVCEKFHIPLSLSSSMNNTIPSTIS